MSISSVTSEALQAKLRQLLPSQQGFGTDISAQDTIVPIIDLTATAEGSGLPTELQQAIAFGNAGAFSVFNNTVDIVQSPGFYRVTSNVNVEGTGADQFANLIITDTATSKTVWSSFLTSAFSTSAFSSDNVDLILFVDTNEIVRWDCSNHAISRGSVRQIATKNGVLVNPIGFNPQ